MKSGCVNRAIASRAIRWSLPPLESVIAALERQQTIHHHRLEPRVVRRQTLSVSITGARILLQQLPRRCGWRKDSAPE